MLSIKVWLCAPIFISSVVLGMYWNRTLEGYPGSFTRHCDGLFKPALITPESLKLLTITVAGVKWMPGKTKRIFYNYYQMKQLARDPTMDYNKTTVMFVGGLISSAKSMTSMKFVTEYKKWGYNVWILEINRFNAFYFPAAARMSRELGRRAAEMLAYLTALNAGFDPKKFELIGMSLGSQTAGFIGKSYKALTGQKLSRITGLDPAGPCFRTAGPEHRLDESDADRVDVISTNIDVYGIAIPMGHVTFYVNGGEHQLADNKTLFCGRECSHVRSLQVWFQAMRNPNSFIAIQCDSVQQARSKKCYDKVPVVTNVLGLNTDFSKPGIYYLSTSNLKPFYLGENGLNKSYENHKMNDEMINLDDILTV